MMTGSRLNASDDDTDGRRTGAWDIVYHFWLIPGRQCFGPLMFTRLSIRKLSRFMHVTLSLMFYGLLQVPQRVPTPENVHLGSDHS
jgi:hypothetical protein